MKGENMKTKDFLKQKYNVDVSDFSQVENNNIRNQMIFDGFNDGDVFEKDIKDLTDEEIFSLFAKRYMNPGNGAWSFNEIVEKGKKELEKYLQL